MPPTSRVSRVTYLIIAWGSLTTFSWPIVSLQDAKEEEVKVQVCVFVFDLLFLNGESLVREPLRKRRSLLREALKEVPGETQFARSADLATVEDIQEFLDESIKGEAY